MPDRVLATRSWSTVAVTPSSRAFRPTSASTIRPCIRAWSGIPIMVIVAAMAASLAAAPRSSDLRWPSPSSLPCWARFWAPA
jgi:hypothetical protein